LLVAGGTAMAMLGLPASAGVTDGAVADTVVAPYNVVPQLDDSYAAVIVEPVAANMGLVPPAPGFLEGLRAECDRVGALLIFDEVITGFRVARGGAQELFGIRPDLTTFGKIIGGGLPVGAYGASRDIMNHVAPAGQVYQAGTLSGNPLAMTAGLATLRRLRDASVYAQLERAGARLCAGLSEAAREAGITTVTNRVGSMWTTFFTGDAVTDWTSAGKSDRDLYGKFFHAMLGEGVYLAPSQFEAGFIGLAHTDELLDQTVAAARAAFARILR
ncbi:MAG TPA: aminotransferase class III-fold pyridoxal phosphate-dependent enzyme, partial [Pyrinomonadaceae bacterium]|nr:aminotransferase class III-fold pyridoxal phosphate-dependent enzyme [Pyrinomonadaceae bacterium]